MKKYYATAIGLYSEEDWGGPPPFAYDVVYLAKDLIKLHGKISQIMERVSHQVVVIEGDGESALGCIDTIEPTQLALEARNLLKEL